MDFRKSNLAFSRRDIAAALQTAARYHQYGDLQNAAIIYRRVLEIEPENVDALHLLGLISHQRGQHDVAANLIRKALKKAPTSAFFHCNLGVVLLAQGSIDQAAACFSRALRLKPDYPEAENNLGVCKMRQGKLDEASASCRRAVGMRPDYAQAHYNLGLVLQKQGRTSEAIASYGRTLALDPRHADAHDDLGTAFQELGRWDDALSHYEAALLKNPRHAAAHNNIGTLFHDRGRFDDAVAHYEQATRLAPEMSNAHFNLAWTYLERCDVEQAIACFERAQRLEPNDRNKIAIAIALAPIIRSSEDLVATRARITRSLAELRDAELTLTDPVKQGLSPATLFAYHGLDDRPLQQTIAGIYAKACPSLLWTAPHCINRKSVEPGAKVRIGFLSRYFYNHTVGEVMRGLIEHINRDRFDVTVFRIGDEDDHISGAIDAAADHLTRLSSTLSGAREVVADQELDILIYPEIGMDRGTYFLAFSRLASLQYVMWGHPDTTGIPAIDGYVSAVDVEPPNAQEHYSEKLIELEHIPTFYYRPPVASELLERSALGLPERVHLYVCPQTLYKFHPDFDPVLGEILQRDPQGVLLLFEGRHRIWSELLKERFRRAFPEAAERVQFLPRVDLTRYFMVLRHACALLDTFHFGGGNTVYQAFSQGVPVVTMPGIFARGRITYALYRKMGIGDLIATDPDHYVELTLRLGADKVFRDEMIAKIRARSGRLFENHDAVREFETFLASAIQRSAHSGEMRVKRPEAH